ncbi:MAG: hypothetical protein WCT53_01955 [Candidatus Gracilibacteria bacterium]
MADLQKYIKDGLKIVDNLIKQGNLQAALNTCQELLKVNPYDSDVQSYFQIVQEKIIKDNRKKVDADIDATMDLWKEGRYAELAQIYDRLYAYAPGYDRLIGMMAKLEAKISKLQKTQKENLSGDFVAALKKLEDEKRFADMIQACNEMLSMDPKNEAATEYLKRGKRLLVEQKISDNPRIVEGADFERSMSFFNSLLAIDPENETVKKLKAETQGHLSEQKGVSARMDINESVTRMKDLFDHSEYEKVLQACEEIDNIDPGNFTAKIFKTKAQDLLHSESNKLIVKKLKEACAALTPEYKQNPGAFVRI